MQYDLVVNRAVREYEFPEVAILLCTYNGEKFLSKFLESLMSLEIQDFKIYVFDDLSTDSTIEILRNFSERLQIEIYVNTKKLGARDNFLQFLTFDFEHKHSWYFFADQDDIWERKKLNFVEKEKALQPCLVFGDYKLIDAEGKIIANKLRKRFMHHARSPSASYLKNWIPGCTIAFNDSMRLMFSNIDKATIAMHDAFLSAYANALDVRFFCSESITFYRQHSENAIGLPHNTFARLRRHYRRRMSEIVEDLVWIRQANEIKKSAGKIMTPRQLEWVRLVTSLNHDRLRMRLIAAWHLRNAHYGILEKIYFLIKVAVGTYRDAIDTTQKRDCV